MTSGAGAVRADRPWAIETHGIDAIPDAERHGQPAELFWIWVAANIGLLGVTDGALLVVYYRLDLWQAAVAAVVPCCARDTVQLVLPAPATAVTCRISEPIEM